MAKNEKAKEFLEIGGSPAPGITLQQALRVNSSQITHIAWSPDGRYLALSSLDKTIQIWNVQLGKCITILKGHAQRINCVAWAPDNNKIASGSFDNTIRIWDLRSGENLITLKQHERGVNTLEWAQNGRKLISGSDDSTICIWDTESWKLLNILDNRKDSVTEIHLSPDGKRIAACVGSKINVWNLEDGIMIQELTGHAKTILGVAWIQNHPFLASCGHDITIRLWDLKTGKNTNIIEGHTQGINSLSVSPDGNLLASKSIDNTIRIWRTDSWETLAILNEKSYADKSISSIAFHPYMQLLASVDDKDRIIRIWDLDYNVLIGNEPASESVRYTTTKIVLVGDSGVGKTGLGWRLAHGNFKEHASTHGQQFWIVDELGITRKDGTECEAVLWDLAGQHVYRPVHTIFLDNIDAALVLFDPTNREEPLKGTQFWLEQLKGRSQLPPTILVGARVDRGASVLSQEDINLFCQQYGIAGGYIGTSAMSGEGLDKLLETLKAQIPWDRMTTTVTTLTFKRVKQYVLSLKEKPYRKKVLVHPTALSQQLQKIDKNWQFSNAEMMTASQHLENHGYVSIIHSSNGDTYILLSPDLLVDLASSIILLADKNPYELGAVSETELLQGKYSFEEIKGLEETEKIILLEAAVLRFLEHSVCFRETVGNETLLIFPGLIKQKRPLQDKFEFNDDVSYIVRGRTENIYAALVVLLGYTRAFTRINQWKNQAQYEMGKDEICGFRLIEEREGEIEFILYYSTNVPEYGRSLFQGLLEKFLYTRNVEVERFPPTYCPNNHRLERASVIKRIREGKTFSFCDECGEKTSLPETEKTSALGRREKKGIEQEEALAQLRNIYEAHISRVKSFRRDRATPRCYISYTNDDSEWVEYLIRDLRDAGIIILDDWSQFLPTDFAVLICSSPYSEIWQETTKKERRREIEKEETQITDKHVSKDVESINSKIKEYKTAFIASITSKEKDADKKNESIRAKSKRTSNTLQKPLIIPLMLDDDSCPHDLDEYHYIDFRENTSYAVGLFDLVLNLYAIPLNHQAFEPLRFSMTEKWEQSLQDSSNNKTKKLFISYSHKDEEFKDEFITMLSGLQRRGIIDAWQDRRIEEGGEWYQDIQTAINDCDIAILLVSANFIASRFIQDEELPKLLKRRMESGLRVMPIIIRQCVWQSEPIISDIQVLPRDGKPVITYSKDNGDRDQVWTDIAKVIEKRAKQRSHTHQYRLPI